MADDLETAARDAGLVDLDLLKLAKVGASPADTIGDLRTRYPGAFHASRQPLGAPIAHDVRGMSRADADAEIKRYLAEAQRYHLENIQRATTARVMEQATAKERNRAR
jgi:hypothetical protein